MNSVLNKEDYRKYLETLLKSGSKELFNNRGIEYASILMSVLFDNTVREARMLCEGFKPELIMTEPYLQSLKNYLNAPSTKLKVLVETSDYKDAASFQLLVQTRKNRGNEDISYRLIKKEDKQKIFDRLGLQCNFAVFDDKMFRLEYEPQSYMAYGSFNHPDNSRVLTGIFEEAFENAGAIE